MATPIHLLTTLLLLISSIKPTIEFEKKDHNFGNIQEGKIINIQYEFTNTSNTPLVLYDVQGSCGCTATSFPTFPIKPNQKEHITIKFMSKGKNGQINMHIVVKSNAQTQTDTLYLSGQVQRRP